MSMVSSSECGSRSDGADEKCIVKPSLRKRLKTQSGETVVTTPWFPDGAVKERTSLGEEVVALHNFMSLTEQEEQQRFLLRSTLQDIIHKSSFGVTVKVYGSAAYGSCLPMSRIDFLVEHFDVLQDFKALLTTLKRHNEDLNVNLSISNGEEAFIRATTKSGLTTNVTFNKGVASTPRKQAAYVRNLFAAFPAARFVFTSIRIVLQQSKCNDAATGGLSSYAVLLMLFHVCLRCSDPADAGLLLTYFFAHFSTMPRYKISPESGVELPLPEGHQTEDQPKSSAPRASDRLFIYCPILGGNIADSCTRVTQVCSVFHNCSVTLAKWHTTKWIGYRGRTPLSCLVAFDSLWARADALHAMSLQEEESNCEEEERAL